MLSPAVPPRAQQAPPRPRTPPTDGKENAHRARFSRARERASAAPPLSPRVANAAAPAHPPGLKQRRLGELDACVESRVRVPAPPSLGGVQRGAPELKQRRLTDLHNDVERARAGGGRAAPQPPCGRVSPVLERRQRAGGEMRKAAHPAGRPCVSGTVPDQVEDASGRADRKLVDGEEKVKESRKRRFGDVDTRANSETRHANVKKRMHKDATASTPTAVTTTSNATPNPFDPGFAVRTATTERARPNPFDDPSRRVTSTAAPVRSYRLSAQVRKLPRGGSSLLNNPPIRELVSYADLWEGVSSIESGDRASTGFRWTYDPEAPMYDFLYHGSWKRRRGSEEVSAPKRKRVFWRGDCWYGGWCRIGACARRMGAYRDLDCPHSKGLIVDEK